MLNKPNKGSFRLPVGFGPRPRKCPHAGERPYGPDDDAFILAHYRPGRRANAVTPGWSAYRIGEHLGERTSNSIVSRYHRLKQHQANNTKPDYSFYFRHHAEVVNGRVESRYGRADPSMPKLKFLGER